MDKGEQIRLLRAEHSSAIESFDFDRAETIAKQIKRLQGEVLRDSFSGGYPLDLDEERESLLNERTVKETQFMSARTDVQKRFHARYKEMQDRHADEMTLLAEAEAEALARESSRRIPDVARLELEAKLLGREHNYREAKRIYQEANRLKREVIDKRLVAVKADFMRQRRKLQEKHNRELKLLGEKREQAMSEVDQRHMRDDEVLTKQMRVQEVRARHGQSPRAARMRAVSPVLSSRRRAASVARETRSESSRGWGTRYSREY